MAQLNNATCPICKQRLFAAYKIYVSDVAYFICGNCYTEMHKCVLMSVTGEYAVMKKLVFHEC